MPHIGLEETRTQSLPRFKLERGTRRRGPDLTKGDGASDTRVRKFRKTGAGLSLVGV